MEQNEQKPVAFVYYAFGPGRWGKGVDPDAAKKQLRKEGYKGKQLLVYKVSENATFYSDGSFGTPAGEPQPVLIEKRDAAGKWLDPDALY